MKSEKNASDYLVIKCPRLAVPETDDSYYKIVELLKANGQENVKIFLGGIIPDEDMLKLKELGVSGVYGPGTSTEFIVSDVRSLIKGE